MMSRQKHLQISKEAIIDTILYGSTGVKTQTFCFATAPQIILLNKFRKKGKVLTDTKAAAMPRINPAVTSEG